MQYLKTLTDEDIFKKPEFPKPEVFEKRTTVKAVVTNNNGKFGFVTNPIHNFYLLPGGGAESDNLEEEIQRECDEEINFKVEVIKEIGRIHEYRNRDAIESETVCFSVKVVRESCNETRTDDERKNGLRVVWFDKDEAVKILKSQVEKVKKGEVDFYNTAFNIVRDKAFFDEFISNQL